MTYRLSVDVVLQLMLCGMQEIDVDDWQRNTKYKSYTPNSQQVVWFWKVRGTLSLCFLHSQQRPWCQMVSLYAVWHATFRERVVILSFPFSRRVQSYTSTVPDPQTVAIMSNGVFARDSIYAKRAYAIAIPSVCPSVCLSVTRVDQSKTVEVRIMQFSPYSSPIPLVFVR